MAVKMDAGVRVHDDGVVCKCPAVRRRGVQMFRSAVECARILQQQTAQPSAESPDCRGSFNHSKISRYARGGLSGASGRPLQPAKRLTHTAYLSTKPCRNFRVPSLVMLPSSAIRSSLK